MSKNSFLYKLKRKFCYYWKQAKPSVKVFGKVTWFMTKLVVAFVLIAGMAAGGVAAGIVVGVLKDVPDIDPGSIENVSLPSIIYDINGKIITEIHDEENRTLVSFDEIPDVLKHAFLAAEDNNFYDHPGFDVKGILRAFVTGKGGGSTITQQLVKQRILSPEQTLRRKLQEVYLAVKLEKHYTKDEIFEFYMNTALYFGNSAYGVEAAAQTYFGKHVGDLTLSEAALLAGIPNWPHRYAPNPDNLQPALDRREDVLYRMIRFGYITREEGMAAMQEEIVLAPRPTRAWPYPYYVDCVVHHYAVEALVTQGGIYETRAEADRAIRRGGLHIYTAMDPNIQKLIQDEFVKPFTKNTYVDPSTGLRSPQAAMVVMEAKTGRVLAMVGGLEYNSVNKYNRARLASRQPGSSIKPVIVYGPAFEKGDMGTGTTIDDAPTAWPDSNRSTGYWAPENVLRIFKGMVTAREALVFSDNIPAIKTFQETGGRYSVETAERLLGKKLPSASSSHLTSAIGGSSYGVSPLEMARAYSAFANKGVASDPMFITRIDNKDGITIFEGAPKQEVVVSEETAFMMTEVLKDVISRGTATSIKSTLGNLNVAGKTGTTDSHQDRWFVGYSPDYVISIWAGNDKLEYVDERGRTVSSPGLSDGMYGRNLRSIWAKVAKATIKENTRFPGPPSGVVRVSVCAKSGLRPSELCPDVRSEWFLKNSAPTEICDMHVNAQVCEESGLLANDYCPESSLVTRTFLNRPPFIPTDDRWSGATGRIPRDGDRMPPLDYCNVHGPNYDLNGSYGNNGVTITWNTDLLDDYAGYNLYRKNPGQTNFVRVNDLLIGISIAQYVDNIQPIPGLTYVYQLKVVNHDNTERVVHTALNYVRPLNLELSGSYNQGHNDIRLLWKAPAAGNVVGYNVYRNGVKITPVPVTLPTNPNPFIDANISAGMVYEYRVSVVYSIDSGPPKESVLSSAVTISTPGQTEPPEDPDPPEDEDARLYRTGITVV